MSESSAIPSALERLRTLRDRTHRLNRSLREDLAPFFHAEDKISFRRLPTSGSEAGDVNVATTCSALMALSLTRETKLFYKDKTTGKDRTAELPDLFARMMKAKWASSGLADNNPFTTSVVLRTFGMVAAQESVDVTSFVRAVKVSDKGCIIPVGEDPLPEGASDATLTLAEIAGRMFKAGPEHLVIHGYPPAPTIAYWLVDACAMLGVEIDHEAWRKMATWASGELARQINLVSAKHVAMMDPIALAMAACLVMRLRRWATDRNQLAAVEKDLPPPSLIELANALRLFFDEQQASGIWHKYFPLFHYPRGGANHCFAGELLEALLSEYGRTDLLEQGDALDHLERALRWFEDNRLEFQLGQDQYRGWNSGGMITTLQAGVPESWASAVVHMFLWRLREYFDRAIDAHARRALRAEIVDHERTWNDLIDIDVSLGDDKTTLLKVLRENFIDPAPEKRKRSALLFGPPGTSKTSVVKQLAKEANLPFVSLDPSQFLRHGFERIAPTADDIFSLLFDMRDGLAFFDEMDPLVAKRGEGQIFVRQAMTTVLLPKLATLYDKRRVMFFMATNHFTDLDPAIRRPGRFDFLLCMGPPTWEKKLESLKTQPSNWKQHGTDAQLLAAHGTLKTWSTDDQAINQALGAFTVGETHAFYDQLRKGQDLATALSGMKKSDFSARATEWSTKYIVLRNGSEEQKEYAKDLNESRRQ